MAQVADPGCLTRLKNREFYEKHGFTILEANRCWPGCVQTLHQLYQFDLTPDQQAYFYSFDPIPYETCMEFKNCEPRCLNAFSDAGVNALITQDAKDIAVQQRVIDTQVEQRKTKTYLLVGGSIAAALLLIYLGSRK